MLRLTPSSAVCRQTILIIRQYVVFIWSQSLRFFQGLPQLRLARVETAGGAGVAAPPAKRLSPARAGKAAAAVAAGGPGGAGRGYPALYYSLNIIIPSFLL